MEETNVVILAAGQGKRMRAVCSKVLCTVAEKPMLLWVTDAARKAGVEHVCVVASEPDVIDAVKDAGFEVRIQTERLGTGHATRMAMDFLEAHRTGDTLVLCGDAPFMDSDTIQKAYRQHKDEENALTVVTAQLEDGGNYGRIIRDGLRLAAIVERADCTPEQAAIREINSGAFWFRTDVLIDTLGKIRNNNAQGEYYLTDAVELIIKAGERAGACLADTPDVVLGANDPAGLLLLNETAKADLICRHLNGGVQFELTDGVVIGPDVEIEAGALIRHGTTVTGKTRIRRGAVVGPNSVVRDSEIGEGAVVDCSFLEGVSVGAGEKIGPFVTLRG